MKPLSKAQIDEMTALLAPFGLVVKQAPKPRKPNEALTVKQVLAKSKWYRPPTLASLGKPYGRIKPSFVETNYRFKKATGTYEAKP